MQGSAVFNGVFELQDGVSEEEFLPTLKGVLRALHRDGIPELL